VCSEHPTLTELIDYEGFCGVHATEENPMREVSAADVEALRARGERFLLLDVRDPEEFAKASIPGATLLPLGQLEARLAELADWKDRRIIVHCHHGPRSGRACGILMRAGFTDVTNLAGGIDAWSLTVDPSVPRY
jgi:adenylyltransferase/sulfurtransferase